MLWPSDAFEDVKRDLAVHIPDFERVWDTSYGGRQQGRIDDYFRSLGLDDDAIAACVKIRTEFTRANLVDPAIYLLACERLGVEPAECVFVGDGANDELAGAARVGMRAVCILPPGRSEALWPEARGWEPTISSLPDVLSLL